MLAEPMTDPNGEAARVWWHSWEAVALVAAGTAVGIRIARGRRPRTAPPDPDALRQISWLGRRLDPYPAAADPGLAFPPLPPGQVVGVPDRGEMFVRVARREEGDGIPILLLHGWMATADLNWFLLYEALSGRHTVIAPDLRGHGRGIRSPRPFTIEDCADDVAGLLRRLGIEKAVAVGYSMGGPVALELWRRHRELVAGLVLEATGLQFSSTPLQQTAWRMLGVGGVLLRWPTGRMVLFRLGGALREIPDELLAYRGWADGEFRRNDPLEVVEAGRALSRFDARPFARSVDVPTSVVVTTGDRMVPPSEQRALAEATGARVFEFDADHSAVAVRPREFAEVTLEAVAAVLPEAEEAADSA